MIDGIKFPTDPKKVSKSDVLDFRRIDENRQTAKYRGLIVDLYENSCWVRGSVHKYKNDGKHNTDDFRLSDFIHTLNDMAVSLSFNPETTRFCNLEFGVNIELPYDAWIFIRSVVCTKGILVYDKKGITIPFSEYRIKIYQKGTNLLRYEISLKTTSKIKQIAGRNFCSTLSDLTNPDIWRALGAELLKVYDSLLVIVDRNSIDTKNLSEKENTLLLDGYTPGYWKKKRNYTETRRRELNRFKKLIQNHSTPTMREYVRVLIAEKIDSSIDIKNVTFSPSGNSADMLRFSHMGNEKDEAEKNEKCYDFQTWITNENVTGLAVQNRVCDVTGLPLVVDIKQRSYLSARDVEFYYNNHKEIYDIILAVRLSKKWLDQDLKIQFREIGHSVRNEKSNFRRNVRRLESNGLLFGIDVMIRPDKQKYLQWMK